MHHPLKDGSVVTGGGRDGKLIHFDANYKKSDQETEVMTCVSKFWLLEKPFL